MLVVSQQREEFRPEFLSLASILEGVCVPNHDDAISTTREKDVQTFW